MAITATFSAGTGTLTVLSDSSGNTLAVSRDAAGTLLVNGGATPMNAITLTAPDYAAIKQRQQTAWASGDYSKIGTPLRIADENLAETMSLAPGSSVLDVTADNDNARRRFAALQRSYLNPRLSIGGYYG